MKVAWAKQHLRSLDAAVKEFVGRKFYSISTEDDLEAGHYVIRIDIEPIPGTFGLHVGDFISCLRSSLDHIIWQLTLQPGGSRNESAFFPIIPVSNHKGRKQFSEATRGVPTLAVAVIDALQPYHRGDAYSSTEMWKLHRLWNIDKHRRIPFDTGGVQIDIGYPHDVLPIDCGLSGSGEVRFPLTRKSEIELKPTVKFNALFGDVTEGVLVTLKELAEMHEFVCREVLPKFQRFF